MAASDRIALLSALAGAGQGFVQGRKNSLAEQIRLEKVKQAQLVQKNKEEQLQQAADLQKLKSDIAQRKLDTTPTAEQATALQKLKSDQEFETTQTASFKQVLSDVLEGKVPALSPKIIKDPGLLRLANVGIEGAVRERERRRVVGEERKISLAKRIAKAKQLPPTTFQEKEFALREDIEKRKGRAVPTEEDIKSQVSARDALTKRRSGQEKRAAAKFKRETNKQRFERFKDISSKFKNADGTQLTIEQAAATADTVIDTGKLPGGIVFAPPAKNISPEKTGKIQLDIIKNFVKTDGKRLSRKEAFAVTNDLLSGRQISIDIKEKEPVSRTVKVLTASIAIRNAKRRALFQQLDNINQDFRAAFVGPIDAGIAAVARKTPLANKLEEKFSAEVATFFIDVVAAFAGKAITANEMRRIEKQVMQVWNTEKTFQARFEVALETLIDGMAADIRSLQGFGLISPDELKDDQETLRIAKFGVRNGRVAASIEILRSLNRGK